MTKAKWYNECLKIVSSDVNFWQGLSFCLKHVLPLYFLRLVVRDVKPEQDLSLRQKIEKKNGRNSILWRVHI